MRPPGRVLASVRPLIASSGMRIREIAVVLVVAMLALACTAGRPDPGASPTSAPPTGASTASPVAPATTPADAPPANAELSPVQLERYTSLAFPMMTGLHQMPDGRWLVLEQQGRIMTFREGDSQATVFLDLRDRVTSGGEEGLLGLALAPDFATSGVFFVDYSAANPRRSVLSSFTSSGAEADRASERIILEVAQPFANHNGGQLAFGPDGFLYYGLGDGGSGGDPQGHGQNKDTLLGSLLRIDVRDRTRYVVPPDNPLVGQAGRPEIWAYGLRNPWRFSFDTATGALWLADVGQNSWEEVNLITKGGNYGWNIMEGAHCFRGASCDQAGLVLPIFEYARSGGDCSVTGGFVYRGSQVPALRGAYVYGDYCSGSVWALRSSAGVAGAHAEIAMSGTRIGSFAQDRAGEVYVLEHATQGRIFRIAP